MSKALHSKLGQKFTVALSVLVIFCSVFCWGVVLNRSFSDQTVAHTESSNFSSKAKSATKFGGQYMIITGVITAVANYLPFRADDRH